MVGVGVGYRVIPSNMFLSHNAEKVRGVTLQCFRNIPIGKNLWRRDGGYYFFPSNFFLSHSAEKFRGRTLQCFRIFGVSKKFMHKKGISLFSVEFFCLTVPTHFLEKPLCFRKFPVSKNFMAERGGIWWFSVEFVFVSQYPKITRGNSSEFQKISGIEKFYAKEGEVGGIITTFRRNCFVLQYRNIS